MSMNEFKNKFFAIDSIKCYVTLALFVACIDAIFGRKSVIRRYGLATMHHEYKMWVSVVGEELLYNREDRFA